MDTPPLQYNSDICCNNVVVRLLSKLALIFGMWNEEWDFEGCVLQNLQIFIYASHSHQHEIIFTDVVSFQKPWRSGRHSTTSRRRLTTSTRPAPCWRECWTSPWWRGTGRELKRWRGGSSMLSRRGFSWGTSWRHHCYKTWKTLRYVHKSAKYDNGEISHIWLYNYTKSAKNSTQMFTFNKIFMCVGHLHQCCEGEGHWE